jgi:hypothetical protein
MRLPLRWAGDRSVSRQIGQLRSAPTTVRRAALVAVLWAVSDGRPQASTNVGALDSDPLFAEGYDESHARADTVRIGS